MKLFTKEIDKKLFAQYPKGNNLEEQMVVGKIFNPYGNGRWYLLNSDPQDPDYLWAIVQMGKNVEIGSVSRKELENIRISAFRFPLERDLGFRPVNAYELLKGLREGKFYKSGGFMEQSENKEMLLNQAEEIEHHVEEFEEAAKKSDHVPAWVVAKAERASTDLSDASHYLEAENEQKREEMEGEEEYAYGGEVKWQEAEYGDSALVVSENKMGIIMKPYGRKFHLKFVDGTEKTYDANDLKFFKDMDEFDLGGKMAEGGGTSAPNIEFMKWFVDWSKSVNKYVYVSITKPNEFSSPVKDDSGKIVILNIIEKKGDTDAKKYINEMLKKADEFGVSIYLQPIPRTHNLKSQEHKNKITKDYLIKYYQKFGFENTDGGFMVREPKMAKGGWIKSDKQEDFYYYSTPDKKIKTPFWYSVHEVKDIGSKETLHWSVERGGTNNMGYLKNYARKDFKSKDDAFKYAESWAKEVASKFKTSANKMEGGGGTNDGGGSNKELLERIEEVKKDAKDISKNNRLRTYVFDYEFDKYTGKPNRLSERITWGYDDDFEYFKDKGFDKDIKVISVYENGENKMEGGGKVKFADKVKSIKASLLKRKKVPKAVQKDYGKTFSPAEAEDSAKRIVGAQTARERLMMRIKSKKKK